MILYSSDWTQVIFTFAGTVWPNIRAKWIFFTIYAIIAYLVAVQQQANFGSEGRTVLFGTMSFLLIFRANAAYARYWLGRCTLSDYISEVREFMLLSIIYVRGGLESSTFLFHGGPGLAPASTFRRDKFDDKASDFRIDIVRLCVALAVSFKLHTSLALEGYCFGSISKEAKWSLDWDRLRLLELLTDEEFEVVNICIGLDDEIPTTAEDLRKQISRQFRKAGNLTGPPQNWPEEFEVNYAQLVRVPTALVYILREVLFRNMNDPFNGQPWGIKDRFVGALAGILGGILESFETANMVCTTPVPLPYANLCKTLLMFFLLSLPFYVDFDLGWFANTVIPSMITLALLGVDSIATELENPFGDDINDLDTLEQVHILECEAMELLRQSGDERSLQLFGWQHVPAWVSDRSCRKLKRQLVMKELALHEVMPLQEDDIPKGVAWLMDRREDVRTQNAEAAGTL